MTLTAVSTNQIEYPTDFANAKALKVWIDAITAAANLGTVAAGALTADAGGRAVIEDAFFDEATCTAKIVAQAITGALIKDGHITATQLASDAVTTAKILNANVTAAKLASNAVETAKIAALAVTTAKLAAGVISADAAGRALFADDILDAATVARIVDAKAIDTGSIADGAIEALQLNADAVTTAKILNANVTAAKLAAVLCSAPTTLSGAGAIPITAPTCLFTSTGAAQALTVADGTYAGQRLTIVHVVDGGSGVITQTTGAKLSAPIATITIPAAYDTVTLEWSGALWNPVAWSGTTAIVNT
jgi:hypothetical protein